MSESVFHRHDIQYIAHLHTCIFAYTHHTHPHTHLNMHTFHTHIPTFLHFDISTLRDLYSYLLIRLMYRLVISLAPWLYGSWLKFCKDSATPVLPRTSTKTHLQKLDCPSCRVTSFSLCVLVPSSRRAAELENAQLSQLHNCSGSDTEHTEH